MTPIDAFLCLAAYLLGSLPVAFMAGRVHGIDIRRAGSGNVGATNAFRTLGVAAGAITLALDMTKGAAAVLLAERLATNPATMVPAAGVCAVIGHLFPVWLGFRGGKGVATAAGVFAVLSPAAVTLACLGFAVTLALTRYVSMASLAAAAVLVVATAAIGAPAGVRAAAAACTALVVYAHRANIRRVLRAAEPRVDLTGRGRDR